MRKKKLAAFLGMVSIITILTSCKKLDLAVDVPVLP